MALSAALSIAGSDPSGGAGIQADLKTFAVLGVYGGAAITCLTAQNTRGVAGYQPVEPALVEQQIVLVLADLPVTHVKIGMVGTPEIAARIGRALVGFRGEVVYDPVFRASSGQALSRAGELGDLYRPVLVRATVLTPNRFELEALTGLPCEDGPAALRAAGTLFGRFPVLRAVLVKGGHLQESGPKITDYLLLRPGTSRPELEESSRPRRQTRNTHGTGCTLAAGFTAFHLRTGSYQEAFHRATGLVDELLLLSADVRLGQGNGPLLHHLYREKTDGR